MRKRRWIGLAVLAALLVLAAIALDPRMIVRHYSVELEEVTAPVRLAVVTDFHGCSYGEDASHLLAAIEEEAPDAMLLVGDIYDDGLSWEDSDALISACVQRWPCYYVTGNHEYWTGRIDEILRRLSDAGVTVLDSECSVLEVRGQRISLCGVTDPYAMVYSGAPETGVQLAKAIDAAEPETCIVLLAHRPELIAQYAALGFDLVVSGHAHGGQMRLPGFLNGLYAPNQGLFPKYAGGCYEVDGTTMIVSRGLARESTLCPRVFNRPELVIVTLE